MSVNQSINKFSRLIELMRMNERSMIYWTLDDIENDFNIK